MISNISETFRFIWHLISRQTCHINRQFVLSWPRCSFHFSMRPTACADAECRSTKSILHVIVSWSRHIIIFRKLLSSWARSYLYTTKVFLRIIYSWIVLPRPRQICSLLSLSTLESSSTHCILWSCIQCSIRGIIVTWARSIP